LNYTPQESDGSIDISKALQVNTEFDLSRQLWAYLVKKRAIKTRSLLFIPYPTSVLCVERRISRFLKNASRALSAHHCYHGMEYSDDKKQIEKWIPLVMEGRDPSEKVAATRMLTGTDVDYGALTKDLLDSLSDKEGFSIHFFNRVQICVAMGIYGACGLGMKKAVNIGMSKPNSFSSVLAADRCHCCKNLGFPRGGATPGFR